MTPQQTETYPFPLSRKNRFASETTPDGKYDRTRARQYWHDPAALQGHPPSDLYQVRVVDEKGNSVVACEIPCAIAAVPNIDGIPNFPPVTLGPFQVILMINGGVAQGYIAAQDLIRVADLQTLTASISTDTGIPPIWAEKTPLVGAGEWHLFRAQTQQTAGELWGQQCAMGVGYPGKWSFSAHDGYKFQWAENNVFLPDPNAHFPLDPIPCPMDPLKDGECLIDSPVPMSSEKWVQLKTPQSAGGNDALLQQIAADVKAIKTRIGA